MSLLISGTSYPSACGANTVALLLQMTLPWDTDEQPGPPTLPMALLSAIVRKEALLPEHTAAFAAAQLLPVIQAATERHCASLHGQQYDPMFCRELLVSGNLTPTRSAAGKLLYQRTWQYASARYNKMQYLCLCHDCAVCLWHR